MGKFIIMLNLKDELQNCSITKILDKYRDFNDETLETIGYDFVEVESDETPLLKTNHGNFIPEIVHNEDRFVSQWKPII